MRPMHTKPWLKPPRDTLLFMAAFFLIWTIRATVLYRVDEQIASPVGQILYSTGLKFVGWGLAAAGFAVWARHAPPLEYLGYTRRPGRRAWIVYGLVTLAYLAAITAYSLLSGGKHFAPAGLAGVMTLSGLLSYFVSPLLEETLFRGVFLQETARLWPGWFANLFVSLAFAAIHLPFWLTHGGLTAGVVVNTLGVFLFSLLAGWLYLRSRSIWPPYLAHVANNLLALLLV